MANSINRTLQNGEMIVIKKDHLLERFHPIAQRIGVAVGGFGMSHITMGRMLAVETVADGETGRFEGNDIHPRQTAKLGVAVYECDPASFSNFAPRWERALWRTYTILHNRMAMGNLTPADTWEG